MINNRPIYSIHLEYFIPGLYAYGLTFRFNKSHIGFIKRVPWLFDFIDLKYLHRKKLKKKV